MQTEYLTNPDGQKLAYQKHDGEGPTVVFLAGHGSDMFGSKAEALAEYCISHGIAFLRFDYSGHGLSDGEMMDGTISSWTNDALFMIDEKTNGDVIVVGSSLGGWIMLNVAKQRPERITGCVGIAAAPDFTETLIWESLSPEQQHQMARDGYIALDNPYADEDVIYPYNLITDGRDNLVLDKPLTINCPVILNQGMQDHEVPWQTANQIALALTSEDVTVQLVKSAGHRFSTEAEISLIIRSVTDLLAR